MDSAFPAGPPIIALPEFLERFPWPEKWSGLERPMDFLWRFDLDAGIGKIWPHLIDTSAFNKRLGLPVMEFSEKDGRLHGVSVNAGIRMVWEEVPWEWEYGRGLNSARIYSEGFARYVRARYLVQELGADRVRLYVYFGWIPRGWKGRLILSMGMKQLERKYGEALRKIVELIRLKDRAAQVPEPSEPIQLDDKKLEEIRCRLVSLGIPADLADRIAGFVRSEPDLRLHRIRVRALARRWSVDERELLLAFLQATRLGLFLLTWDVICPHCLGVRNELSHLGEVPEREKCEVCGIDFDATSLNALEVTFRVHPSVRQVAKRLYCAAEPATKTHIKLQRTLPGGAEAAVSTLLGPGHYRLRIRGRKDYSSLEIRPDAPFSKIDWRDADSGLSHELSPLPALRLVNASREEKTFVLEEARIDAEALKPSDLFNFQEFRDLFAAEAVASGVQLDIGRQTILFTDIVGSTKFYATEGDGGAFAQVRRHFVRAYEIVKRHGGAVVKTIGDAVMAGFDRPEGALRAAIDLQKAFGPGVEGNRLRIRATVHSGSCLAVNLNSNIDYFGNTVNLAAKLQSAAGAGEVVFTDPVAEDAGVRSLLEDGRLSPKSEDFALAWSGEKIRIHRIEVR